MERVVLGTVKNKLCAARGQEAASFLRRKCPGLRIELHTVEKTVKEDPQHALFRALAEGEADLAAVELGACARRMPLQRQFKWQGTVLSVPVLLPRTDVQNVLITRKKSGKYVPDAKVETDSCAGCFQLPEIYENIHCSVAPGGVNMEFGLLMQKKCDGILLSADSVKKLNYHRIHGLRYQYMDVSRMVPLSGSAVTALVVRQDSAFGTALAELSDIRTEKMFEIEQQVVSQLPDSVFAEAGDCVCAEIERNHLKIAVYIRYNGRGIRLYEQGAYEKKDQLIKQLVRKIERLVEY